MKHFHLSPEYTREALGVFEEQEIESSNATMDDRTNLSYDEDVSNNT